MVNKYCSQIKIFKKKKNENEKIINPFYPGPVTVFPLMRLKYYID